MPRQRADTVTCSDAGDFAEEICMSEPVTTTQLVEAAMGRRPAAALPRSRRKRVEVRLAQLRTGMTVAEAAALQDLPTELHAQEQRPFLPHNDCRQWAVAQSVISVATSCRS